MSTSCDAATIGSIESGHRSRIDTVEDLAAALGVPVYWLAFGPEAHLPFRQVQSLSDEAYGDPEPKPRAGGFRRRYLGCGERVRQLREDLQLTLSQVAQAANISHQAVLNTETGATVPRLDTIEALAVALDVAPGWLAYGVAAEGTKQEGRLSTAPGRTLSARRIGELNELRQRLAAGLRKLLRRRKLTVESAAEKAGCSSAYFEQMTMAASTVRIESLIRALIFLGASADDVGRVLRPVAAVHRVGPRSAQPRTD